MSEKTDMAPEDIRRIVIVGNKKKKRIAVLMQESRQIIVISPGEILRIDEADMRIQKKGTKPGRVCPPMTLKFSDMVKAILEGEDE